MAWRGGKQKLSPQAWFRSRGGPTSSQWPQRVAVVAYGRHACYHHESLRMGAVAAGAGLQIEVASPEDLASWAKANGVRIPTFHYCRVLFSKR
jgi:hypothetical protein